jgi:predicted dehydrogenase/threonine dehydrogenase-like Zn-dependent dehydrogenase
MKQLIQSVSTGELAVLDVPAPEVRSSGILVRTRASLVSAGTERTITSFAQASLMQKARSRPDLVRQTVAKAKRDGVLDTIDAVRNRLDQAMTLGYSAAGEVIAVGSEVSEFRVGDRVACAGGGHAVHAQVLSVPRTLAVRIPDSVTFEEAAFSTLGAIALHGIRLAAPQLGDVVGVIGLGLLGQLTIQMLRAAGCRVAGIDLQADRVALARTFGIDWAGTDAEEFTSRLAALSGGHGADVVLITADAPSDQPVELAGAVARSRGVIVAVGNVGTKLPRKVYFEKELDFRISRSYGPGRYDPEYEEKGRDYPYAYVRWTENRNLAAFAELVAAKQVNVAPLISHRFDIDAGEKAYDLILGRTGEPFLGVVLGYEAEPNLARRISVTERAPLAVSGASLDRVRVGVLGAGLFANATLLPALAKTEGVELAAISSSGGVTARTSAKKFGFAYCASSADEILGDPSINTVAILTRHDLHARQVQAALRAGKQVFVEKPLCLTYEELDEIDATLRALPSAPMLMVGYNRRFAPLVVPLHDALREVREPLLLTARVNAGFIPPEHWTHDPAQGGGRLRGEGCHFIDLLMHLAGDRVRRVTTRPLPDNGRYRQDNFQVTLEFENGSLGTLTYAANGSRSFGKEAFEAFGGGLAARLDDYRSLHIDRNGKTTKLSSHLRLDKGHRGEWAAIVNHLTRSGATPIAIDELFHSTRVTLAAYDSLRSGEPVVVGER